jgi:hypothetical protein
MSTTYLSNNNSNALYFDRSYAATTRNYVRPQVKNAPTREGIDEGLLMIGVFCFLVPTMFLAAALGLNYLLMSDLVDNGIYISAGALFARVATAFIIKNIAAEKNRSEAGWMTIAMIAPSVSLILMSFFGTIIKKEKNSASATKKSSTATIKKHQPAREFQMHRTSQAI